MRDIDWVTKSVVLGLAMAWLSACGGDDPDAEEPTDTDDSEEVVSPSFESRTRVAVTWAAGGVPPGANRYLAPPSDSFESLVGSLGLDFEDGAEWPSEPDDVRAVFWIMPYADEAEAAVPSSADLDWITTYLSGGGRLVVVGDRGFSAIDGYSGFQSQEGVDALLLELGVGIRLAADDLVNPESCSAPSHPLSVSSLSQPAGQSLELVAPATWLSCNGAAYQTVSGGELIVVGDTQTFFMETNDEFSTLMLTEPPVSSASSSR